MKVTREALQARIDELLLERDVLRQRIEELTSREDAVVNRLKLTQREFRMAHYLAEKSPYTCRKDQLLVARNGWQHLDDVDSHTKMTDVMICKIRKRLEPVGIEIETDWGVGYRMPSKSAQLFMKLAYEVEAPHLKIGERKFA